MFLVLRCCNELGSTFFITTICSRIMNITLQILNHSCTIPQIKYVIQTKTIGDVTTASEMSEEEPYVLHSLCFLWSLSPKCFHIKQPMILLIKQPMIQIITTEECSVLRLNSFNFGTQQRRRQCTEIVAFFQYWRRGKHVSIDIDYSRI